MNFNKKQLNIINAREPKILCLAAAASGKAVDNSEILPTPSGFKRAGDVQIGDYLFDADGNPTKVLGVYPQGKLEAYVIVFGDGRSTHCSKDHIWYVHNDDWVDKNEYREYTVEQLLNEGLYNSNKKEKFFIPASPAVDYFERQDNENLSSDYFYEKGVFFSNDDDNKGSRIPDSLKFSSIENRFELVKGFVDSNGYFIENGLGIKLKSLLIALDLRNILGSLGFVSFLEKEGKNNYNLLINIPKKDIYKFFSKNEVEKSFAFSLRDKEESKEYDRVSIKEIKRLYHEVEMTCFYVDNKKHLFLTNDFIVTHNTRVLTERVRKLIEEDKVATKDIVAITFTNLAADEMKKRLGDISNGMFIGTLHSYAARICNLSGIDIQEYIDNEQFDKIIEKALVVRSHIYPEIKHLLIDECQDLNDLNYKFINKIPTENIFYVGDVRQMIYAFRGASIKSLLNVYNDPEFKRYYLNDNYRNTPQIIDFAEQFLKKIKTLSPPPTPIKSDGKEVEKCSFDDALTELIDSGNWGSWFILCRTNAQVFAAQQALSEQNIPFISFKKGDFTQDELDELMASDRVKVLTIHTSKGLEAPNVIVTGGLNFNDEECRICYVAATRAQNRLYWTKPIVSSNKKIYDKKIPVLAKTAKKIIEF